MHAHCFRLWELEAILVCPLLDFIEAALCLTFDCYQAFQTNTSPASPTGLHVVRTGYGSYGRGHILHLSSAETTVSINTKFWTNDYVGQTTRIAKFGSNRFYGSGSPCGWSIQLQILGFFLLFFSSCFVNSPTDRNSQRILTYDGSKDLVWCKDVPFECPKRYNRL